MTETLEITNLLDGKLENRSEHDDGPANDDGMEAEEFEDQESAFKPDISGYAGENAAVARCCNAFTAAFLSILAADPDDTIGAKVEGDEAYCRAMPPLNGSNNIRDFIACTAHGILTDVFERTKSSRLLYAAQVAHSSRIQQTRNKKAPSPTKYQANKPFVKPAKNAQTTSEQQVVEETNAQE